MKEKAVDTKLSGAETADQALALLKKHYDHATVVRMLNRGEYDVLYRAERNETTSEQRKAQKRRLDMLEKEFIARGGKIEDLDKKLKG
jgi:hypothetical protein